MLPSRSKKKDPVYSLDQGDIRRELSLLRREVGILNRHRFIRMMNSPGRMLWFNFVRGLAFGLGSVLGASVLVSVVAYGLAQIDYIPIIGEWAREIAVEIRGEPSPADALPADAKVPPEDQ